MFLEVYERFTVTPCCDLKRVQMFTQHALSRVMMGWGICTFYSSVGTQSWCLLHIQKVRLGRERKVLERERKVLAAEQRGTCP